MSDDFDVILKRFDKIEDRLLSIDKTLVVNTHQLTEHMRRTELLERAVERNQESFVPIKDHVTRVNTVLKVLGVLAASAGTVASVLKVIEFFSQR